MSIMYLYTTLRIL